MRSVVRADGRPRSARFPVRVARPPAKPKESHHDDERDYDAIIIANRINTLALSLSHILEEKKRRRKGFAFGAMGALSANAIWPSNCIANCLLSVDGAEMRQRNLYARESGDCVISIRAFVQWYTFLIGNNNLFLLAIYLAANWLQWVIVCVCVTTLTAAKGW